MDDTSTTSSGDMASALTEALSAASPSAPTTESTPTASASAATTEPPAEMPANVEPPATPGPIPFDRHEAALKNAREKAREEGLAEWRKQHGWAESVDRSAVEQAQRLGQLYTQNRVGFVSELIADALADPVNGREILSLMGRSLAQARGKSAEADAEPQPDINPQTGQPEYTVDWLNKMLAWKDRQVDARLEQRLAPFEQERKAAKERETLARIQTEADQQADAVVTRLKQSPGFWEHRQEIHDAMKADASLTVQDAYIAVVVPKLSHAERAKVVAETHTKAGARTATPSHTSTAAPKELAGMSMADALRHELAAAKSAGRM